MPTSLRSPSHARHVRRALAYALLFVAGVALVPTPARAQEDTTPRINAAVRNVGYAATLGFLYAGVDQLQEDPSEWGKGWSGFGNRLASNVGEFLIQETMTDILSSALHHPRRYTYCPCGGTTHKIKWALQSTVTDVMKDGSRVVAVPRIIGAYAGSFAQAAWLPTGAHDKTQTAFVNGTVSLLIGTGIHLFHELRSGAHNDVKPDRGRVADARLWGAR